MDKFNVTFVEERVQWDGKNVSSQALLALDDKFDLVFGGLSQNHNDKMKYSRSYRVIIKI